MFSLKNKVIVVTGGKGLLGTEIISRLKKAEAIAISADIYSKSENDNEIFIDITDYLDRITFKQAACFAGKIFFRS